MPLRLRVRAAARGAAKFAAVTVATFPFVAASLMLSTAAWRYVLPGGSGWLAWLALLAAFAALAAAPSVAASAVDGVSDRSRARWRVVAVCAAGMASAGALHGIGLSTAATYVAQAATFSFVTVTAAVSRLYRIREKENAAEVAALSRRKQKQLERERQATAPPLRSGISRVFRMPRSFAVGTAVVLACSAVAAAGVVVGRGHVLFDGLTLVQDDEIPVGWERAFENPGTSWESTSRVVGSCITGGERERSVEETFIRPLTQQSVALVAVGRITLEQGDAARFRDAVPANVAACAEDRIAAELNSDFGLSVSGEREGGRLRFDFQFASEAADGLTVTSVLSVADGYLVSAEETRPDGEPAQSVDAFHDLAVRNVLNARM